MKKFFSLLMVVMVLMTIAIPVSAEGETDGSVTINGVTESSTYEIYKLLDLESYNTASSSCRQCGLYDDGWQRTC